MHHHLLAIAVLACACSADSDSNYTDLPGDELDDSSGGTVAGQLSRCNTSGVLGLSRQIVDEINCIAPGALELFDVTGHDNIEVTGAALLPYFAPEAAAALEDVADAHFLQVSSGFRSVIQQHLIYSWEQSGRCGIPDAAEPGSSKHESGRAVDISNAESVVATMDKHGWAQNVPGDWIHFEHLESPDLRGMGVHAFQRLWNRNHPRDPIDEDGDYGPATARRIDRAPAAGFSIGAVCSR